MAANSTNTCVIHFKFPKLLNISHIEIHSVTWTDNNKVSGAYKCNYSIDYMNKSRKWIELSKLYDTSNDVIGTGKVFEVKKQVYEIKVNCFKASQHIGLKEIDFYVC